MSSVILAIGLRPKVYRGTATLEMMSLINVRVWGRENRLRVPVLSGESELALMIRGADL
jgi:hypothetical protein